MDCGPGGQQFDWRVMCGVVLKLYEDCTVPQSLPNIRIMGFCPIIEGDMV